MSISCVPESVSVPSSATMQEAFVQQLTTGFPTLRPLFTSRPAYLFYGLIGGILALPVMVFLAPFYVRTTSSELRETTHTDVTLSDWNEQLLSASGFGSAESAVQSCSVF